MHEVAVGIMIAGLVLVVAGVAWIFLAATNVIKELEPVQAAIAPIEGQTIDWGAILEKILAWLKENVPKKLLPGFGLIVMGIVVFGIGATIGVASSATSGATPTPSPSALGIDSYLRIVLQATVPG